MKPSIDLRRLDNMDQPTILAAIQTQLDEIYRLISHLQLDAIQNGQRTEVYQPNLVLAGNARGHGWKVTVTDTDLTAPVIRLDDVGERRG